jgi:rubredoxin
MVKCKECLVKPICSEVCPDMYIYITNHIDYRIKKYGRTSDFQCPRCANTEFYRVDPLMYCRMCGMVFTKRQLENVVQKIEEVLDEEGLDGEEYE